MSDACEMPAGTSEERIAKALAIAVAYGGNDGSHHKNWTIDQMVRALTGCPVVDDAVEGKDGPIFFKAQGESEAYKELVADACSGEDGPNTYSWEEGIPP